MPAQHPLIALELDWKDCVLSLDISLWLVGGLVVVGGAGYLLSRRYGTSGWRIVELEMSIGTNNNMKFKVQRDTTNLYIAHRIYLELMTRKAALEFEDGKDVVVEVYDSWYKLFGVIRDEIKGLPGNYLQGHRKANELVKLTVEILNEGLRPHLTTYQADFRRFYANAKDSPENKTKSPQEIQLNYPKYGELIADMLKVNKVLKEYADQLQKLIKG